MFCLHACICAIYVSIGSSETGIMDGCEPACGCRKLNPGLLQEHQVLLTTEPRLQHPYIENFQRVLLVI